MTVLALLTAALVLLMDWKAVKLGLDLDGDWAQVSLWGGAMLAPIGLLLVLVCVCVMGRARLSVAAGCLVLGMLAGAAFALSAPYYVRAIATASRANEMYEPQPWVVTLRDAGNNPIALGVSAGVAGLVLSLLALRTLPAGAEAPAELRGLRSVRARARVVRRSLVLNPVRLIFGPIFQRDVRITGRHRSTYVFRALYPALLLGITAIAYIGLTESLGAGALGQYQGSRVAELQALQRLAPQLTYAIAWAQLGLLLFIAPVLTAPSLCEEKRSRTLGSLLTTPLSNLQIVLGKLSSRMVQVVILVAASTPLLLAARVFGGVEAEVILAVVAITLSATLMAASMGIHFSVIHKRPATAAVGGILATGAVLLLPVVAMFVHAMQSAGPPNSVLMWGGSAPLAMGYVLYDPLSTMAGADVTRVWVLNCIVNVTVAGLACLSSAVSLRRVMLREVVNEGAALKAMTARAKRRAAKAARKGRPVAGTGVAPADASVDAPAPETAAPVAADPVEEDAGSSRRVSDRPVLWRELRQSTLGSTLKLVVAIVGILLCGAFLYSRMDIWDESLHMAVAGIAVFAITLQATVASTAVISTERESQSWETLMTTPLTAWQVILGKYFGSLKRMWLIGVVLAGHFLVCMLRGYVHPYAVVEVLAMAVCTPMMLCATGLLFSLVLRRSTAAAIANLGFAAGLWVGLPVLVLFCLEAFNVGGNAEDYYMGHIMCLNPVAMSIYAVGGAVRRVPWQEISPTYDNFWWDDVTPGEFASYVTLACLGALSVVAACLVLANRLFPRLSGRSS